MSTAAEEALEINRGLESLRQERETFNQHKIHDNRWFHLRLAMGITAVVLIPAILFISTYILFNHAVFPEKVVWAACGALFVDVLGLLAAVFKIVLKPDLRTQLKPVSKSSIRPPTARPTRVPEALPATKE